MTSRAKFEDVVHAIRSAADRDRKCALLIGAGCSVKAGIPLARKFVELIADAHPPAYERAEDKTYPKCMAELAPTERRDLIGPFIQEAKINWAHIGIAQLMAAGYVDRVLTTNFDLLLTKACALVGLFPGVYDLAASQAFKASNLPESAVFHLHGQYPGFVQLHTQEDCAQHSKHIKPVFDEAGTGRVWVVVGYSGESDPVFDQLCEMGVFDNRLFWVGYDDAEPAEHVRERLLVDGKYAFYLNGTDADGFFVRVAQKLGCFPPDFVDRPFSYLERHLESLTAYQPPGQESEIDIMERTREVLRDAAAKREPPPAARQPGQDSEPDEGSSDSGEPRPGPVRPPAGPATGTGQGLPAATLGALADSLLMSGNYEAVIALTPQEDKDVPPELVESIAWANVMQGMEFSKQAKTKTGKEADDLFAKASAKYEAALKIKPKMYEALGNWGSILGEQAKTKTGKQADDLFARAYEKYEAALKIKPDEHETLNNWGATLSAQAKTKTGKQAHDLFARAYEKYEAALKIKPDFHEALGNWGNTLGDQAKTKTGKQAADLFAKAYAKYQAALKIKPDFHETLYNWGTTLSAQATIKSGKQAADLFAQAYEKYEAALKIKPDFHEALGNWGATLSAQAKTKTGKEADHLFAKACEKYEAALKIKPDQPDTLSNWGNALGNQAKTKSGKQADDLFAKAYAKYEAALKIKPDKYEALYNWGCALSAQAKTKTGKQADDLLAKACKKYEAALKIKPMMDKALCNWGGALAEQAKTKTGKQADDLFARAYEKYEAALKIKPGDHVTLNSWAGAILTQATGKKGRQRAALIARAKGLAAKAETLSPGEAAYNLACAAALEGEEKECRKWLKTSRKHGELPARDHLEGDTDLDNVRDKKWFKDLLAGL